MRRVAAVVVIGAAGGLVAATPVAAQEPGCLAVVDGRPAADHAGWRDALVVDHDQAVVVAGRSTTPAERVSVHILLPFTERQVWSAQMSSASPLWRAAVEISDVAELSAGLNHLEVRAGACRQSLWVDIDRPAPLTTPVAMAGAAILVVGLVGLATSLRSAAAGRRRLGRSAVSGAAVGLGALLVTNQLGSVPLTTDWLASWLLLPGAVGALLNLAATSGSASAPEQRLPDGAGAGGSAPSAPPPPPPAPRSMPSALPPPAPATRSAPSAPVPPPEVEPAPAAAPPETVEPASPGEAGAAPAAEEGWTSAEPPAVEAVEADPPRESYARLEAPETVVAGATCTVTVGLSPVPVAGVSGPALVRPPTSFGAYDLTIQLVADGFAIADADARRVLRVTADAPYPSFDASLVALSTGADVAARAVQAIFSIDGQTIGFAVRPIAVVADDRLARVQPPPEPVEPAVIGVPTREHAADVTIHVVMGADRPGRLLWTVVPADDRVPVPSQAAVSDIGMTPETFAKKLVQGVGRYDGQPGLFPFLRGAGLEIAEHIPVEITQVLVAAAALVPDRPLTVFFVSEEPYVPWELAVVEPPLWPGTPPFLGAQVELGRWVFGQRRPTLPPPLAVEMRAMAVVSGVYDGTATRLLEAEAEAAALAERYGAVAVDALTPEIIDCLGGQPSAEVLHFAVHGLYDSASVKEGLILLDGSLLDPLQVKGAVVQGAPFVFLNACQVGSGNQLLGDYAGVAQSFLYAGAAAVIAPLWSVSDRIARELALAFYESTFERSSSPAAVLREMRAQFDDHGTESAAATFLAYQFFGHPCLRLGRATS